MEFRRHGPHETRRRRLMTEDNGQAEGEAARGDAPPVRRAKGSGDSLPRVTDLAPRHAVTFFLLFFGGLLVIAGLEALYWFMPQFAKLTTDGTIEAFDLDGEGTLAVWFSSFLLTMCGFTALLIYAVRRRREEDYHARYRVWLWAAVCWFVLSIDETGSLHEGFKEMMTYLSGSRLMGDGSLWWVIAYGLVLGQLALMLWIETKGSWGARTAMVATAVCFAGAVAAQLELFTAHTGVRIGIMIEEGLEMAGDLCLLLGMGLHARFVTRHYSGQRSKAAATKATKTKSKVKKARPARETSREAAETPKAAKTESRPANEPRPVTATQTPTSKPGASISAGASSGAAPRPNPLTPNKPLISPQGASSSASSSSAPSGGLRVDTAQNLPGGTHRKLSKAERKALKREQRQTRPANDDDAEDDE
jgi:hypothetical protein